MQIFRPRMTLHCLSSHAMLGLVAIGMPEYLPDFPAKSFEFKCSSSLSHLAGMRAILKGRIRLRCLTCNPEAPIVLPQELVKRQPSNAACSLDGRF